MIYIKNGTLEKSLNKNIFVITQKHYANIHFYQTDNREIWRLLYITLYHKSACYKETDQFL